MDIMVSDIYKHARSDTQRAIYLPLLMARESGGLLSFKDLQDTYQKLGLKKTAKQVALRFYKKVVEDEEWLRFMRITTDDIYASYDFYLVKDPQGFKTKLFDVWTPFEKTQADLIAYLQDQVIILTEDNMALSRSGWVYSGQLDDLRGDLEERAQKLVELMLTSFKAMGLQVVSSANKFPLLNLEDQKLRKSLPSEQETEDLLSKYSGPLYTGGTQDT